MNPQDLPANASYWLLDGRPCHLDGEQPRPQPGEPADYTFRFMSDPHSGVVTDHVADYTSLRDRARHANSVAIETDIDNDVVYSVTRTDYEPLVRVEPGPYDPTGTAIWGLITGLEDATTLSEAIATLTVSIAFVAPREDYADKAAVRAAHEHRGFH